MPSQTLDTQGKNGSAPPDVGAAPPIQGDKPAPSVQVLAGNDSSGGELELAQHTVGLLERLVSASTDDGDAAQELHDLGQLLLHPLDDPTRALAALKSAHQKQPSVHAARAYRRAALRASAADDVIVALESEARTTQSQSQRAALDSARGTLLVDNPAAARLAFEAAIAAQPSDLNALTGLLTLDIQEGQLARAAEHGRALADAIGDEHVKADMLAWSARLAERAGKLDVARAALGQAEQLAPGSTSPAVRFLAERLHADTQPRALATLLEAQVAEGSLAAADGWLEVGQLARYVLDDATLAERAFAQALEAMPKGDAARVAALIELSELRATAGQAAEAVRADEKRLEGESDAFERALGWTRVGTLREEALADIKGAALAYGKAVEAAPAYTAALEGAGRTYGKLGDADRLLAVHLAEAQSSTAPGEKAAALRRAGELLIADSARAEVGVGYLQAASRLAPEHAGIFLSLERALRKRRDYAALCELYTREIEHSTSPRRKVELNLLIGAIASDQLGDTKRAIAAYRAAAAIPGGAPDHALASLARLLDEGDELAELEPVLAELTTLTEDPVQIASLYERAAQLRLQRGDVDGAVQTYLSALDKAPASHSIHAAAGRAFARAGRWDALLGLYERASHNGSAVERASYGYKVGVVLARRLDRVDDGIAQLERVRVEHPDHLPTLGLLATLYTEQRRWATLRSILSTLPQTPARKVRRALLAESLGHLDEALTLWSDEALTSSALTARAKQRLWARLGRWSELADAYEQGTTPTDRYRAAELRLERTSEPDRAHTILSTAVATASESLPLHLSLLRATKSSDAQARQLLGWLVEHTTDAPLRALWQSQLAALPSLSDDERIDALTKLLTLTPRDPVACITLEAKLEAGRKRAPLVTLLRSVQRDNKMDDGVIAAASTRLGLLLEELGSVREAIDAYELAASASRSLVALLGLPRLYRTIGDAARVRGALQVLAGALPAGSERVSVLRRLATDQLLVGDDKGAAATLEWALREEPRAYDALRELDALVGTTDPEHIVDALMRALPLEPAGPQRLDVGMALAVRQLKVGRIEPARETLERVLADDPHHLRAHLLAAELETYSQEWGRAAVALTAISTHADAPADMKRAALTRLARIQLEALADLQGATRTAQQLEADSLSTLELMLAIAARSKDHAGEAALLEKVIAEPSPFSPAPDDEQRADAQLRLAGLQENELGDVAKAIATLGEIRLPSRRRSAVDRLLDLGSKSDRWDLAAGALEATLDRAGDMDVTWEIAIRRRLASLLEGPLKRSDAAMRQHERIVQLDPSDIPTLERLADLNTSAPDKGDKAIDYHRALLAADPARLASYRALRTLFAKQNEEDGAFLVDSLLEALGVADEEESYFYKQRRAKLRTPVDGTLSEDERALVAPESTDPTFALLHVLAPVLAGVFPVDHAAYGSTESTPAYTGPLAAVADKMGKLFAVAKYQIVAVPNRMGPCVEPPAILFVPRSVEESPPREQSAVLGELLARVAFDGVASDPRRATKLSTAMMEYLLWAACEAALPDATSPHRGRAVYEDIKRRVADATESLPRPALEAAARAVVAAGVQAEALFTATDKIACRAALLCAQDPLLAITSLRERAAAQGTGFAALPAPLRAVLPFIVSAGHLALRRRLQMGVSA